MFVRNLLENQPYFFYDARIRKRIKTLRSFFPYTVSQYKKKNWANNLFIFVNFRRIFKKESHLYFSDPSIVSEIPSN